MDHSFFSYQSGCVRAHPLAALEHSDLLEERSIEMQRAWLRSVAAHKIADPYRRSNRHQQVTLEQVAETLYAGEAFSPEQVALTD